MNGLLVNYFAFGSNMASKVLEGRRGITPIPRRSGIAPGYQLGFTAAGFSPAEPAFASLDAATASDAACHGVVCALTPSDWLRLCATEGVPFGYKIIDVPVSLYDGTYLRAYSLQTTVRTPGRRPSTRYVDLLIEGARENNLRDEWQEHLAGVATADGAPARRRPRARTRDYMNRPGATFV